MFLETIIKLLLNELAIMTPDARKSDFKLLDDIKPFPEKVPFSVSATNPSASSDYPSWTVEAPNEETQASKDKDSQEHSLDVSWDPIRNLFTSDDKEKPPTRKEKRNKRRAQRRKKNKVNLPLHLVKAQKKKDRLNKLYK